MKAYTEVSAQSILNSIESNEDTDNLVKFILEIDEGMMDSGFTEKLINTLVTSLKVDYTKDEIDFFLESLK